MNMLNRKLPPEFYNAIDFDVVLKPYQSFELDNGVQVYAIDSGSHNVLMVDLNFFAGNWYEDKNLVAFATNQLIKNGTRQKTSFDINEHFDFYGAYLNRVSSNETASVTLHCLSRHIKELLPVVSEIISESIFPEHELAIFKQNQKQKLQVNLKKCEFVANRIIDELLYGSLHPYGKYSSLIDYDNLTRDEIADFYTKYYAEGKCIIFVAGKLPGDLQEMLNKNFGHLPLNNSNIEDRKYALHPSSKKHVNIVNDATGLQGAIRIAKQSVNRHHPDHNKLRVLNTIFGGFFGSRLMSNIREVKGYTYGIHSYMQNHLHHSSWIVTTEAGRKVCKATIEEIYKEMKLLCKEPVGEEELNLVKNYIIGTLIGSLDGPFHIIARWKNFILNNLSSEYFYNSIQSVKAISAEEIMELANTYLQPDDFYELVVV